MNEFAVLLIALSIIAIPWLLYHEHKHPKVIDDHKRHIQKMIKILRDPKKSDDEKVRVSWNMMTGSYLELGCGGAPYCCKYGYNHEALAAVRDYCPDESCKSTAIYFISQQNSQK